LELKKFLNIEYTGFGRGAREIYLQEMGLSKKNLNK
jgi:hypothetical protein